MNIKFCGLNSISTKTTGHKSLSDLVKAAQTKQAMQKEASASEPTTKVASVVPAAKVASKKDCGCTTKVAEGKDAKEEGKDSGQPKAEAKLVNQPKSPEDTKKSKSGGGEKGGDEGESSGQLDVEPLHQKGESTQEKAGFLDTMKTDKKEKSAQGAPGTFVKVANLTGKQKEFLRKTWGLYYPASFIDALLADR